LNRKLFQGISEYERLTRKQLEHLPQFDLLAYLGLPTIHPGGEAATKRLLELCRPVRGDTILDVGCGTGRTACYLARKYGCRVVGVDLNTLMLTRFMERIDRRWLGNTVHPIRGDAVRLPFKEESFDLAIVESVLYLVEKEMALKEIRRVLRTGGRIGAIEFIWLSSPIVELANEISKLRGHIFKTLRHEELREAFLNAGFQEIESKEFGLERVNYWELLKEEGKNSLNLLYRYLKIPSTRRKRLKKLWSLETNSKELGYGIYCWSR
jgi:arsenite methyltransferase